MDGPFLYQRLRLLFYIARNIIVSKRLYDERDYFRFYRARGDGAEVSLSRFRGKALLIVNTASRCGFTPQYRGLEELHKAYAARGLVVIGFPCDQFAHQEPGSTPR
jgi:glutathione peroxidase-family protein